MAQGPCRSIASRANASTRRAPSSAATMRRSSSAIARESDAALRTLAGAARPALRRRLARAARLLPAPASARRPGLLVYFHGGYWQELSKAESAFLAPAWHAAGFAHAVVGYTLAPAARLPEIVSECRAAVRWLHARADTLGFDAGNIVVAGSSAGAYLAAACADAAPAPLRGIVPVSGIYDVAPLDRHVDQRRARPGRRDRRRDGSADDAAPVLPRRRRVGRDRDRGVQAPEPGVRRAARERRDPVHVARSSRPQPLRRGARPGRSGVAAVRRRARAVRGGRAASRLYVTAARTRKRSSRHSPDSSTCARRSTASQTSTKRV